MSQLVACVSQHGTHIPFALVIEEAVRGRIYISKIFGTEGFYQITGFVIQLTKIIRVGLDFHTDAFSLYDRKKLLHGLEPHAITDFLLIRVSGQLGVDDLDSHVHCNLNHTFPVGNRELSLLLSRT